MKNTQKKIAEKKHIQESPVEDVESTKHFDLLIEDLKRKILVNLGEPGHGKTVGTKDIVYRVKQLGWIVKVFDISLAWRYNSPIEKYQKVVNPEIYRNLDDCIYDIALLGPDERRNFIASIIKQDWTIRYLGIDADPDYLDYEKPILYVFEEGNSYFSSRSVNRADEAGSIFTDFISARRNYKQSAIIVATAVSGEVATKFRRRCNFLSGKIMGEEERRYLKNGTSKRFMEKASVLRRQRFIYYGGGEVLNPFKFTYREYGTPEIIEITVDEPVLLVPVEQSEPENGQLKKDFIWVTRALVLLFLFLLVWVIQQA